MRAKDTHFFATDRLGLRARCAAGVTAVLVMGAIVPAEGQPEVFTADSVLSGFIREALAANYALVGQRSLTSAAKWRISPEGLWPDPEVMVDVMNLPVKTMSFREEEMTDLWFTVRQMIPTAGKTRLKAGAARLRADAAEEELHSRELKIVRQTSELYLDWSYAHQALHLMDEQVQVMEDVVAAARVRYQSGMGNQSDLLRAQGEVAKMKAQVLEMSQMAASLGRKLSVQMGRPPAVPAVFPLGLPSEFPELDSATLVEWALNHNPMLAAVKSEWEAARRETDLMKREWWPDLMAAAAYGYRADAPDGMERPDFLSLGVGISVPVYGKSRQRAKVQQAAQMEKAMAAERDNMALELRADVLTMLDEDRRLESQINLSRHSIEESARLAFQSVRVNYATGRADFESVLMALNALYGARLEILSQMRNRAKVRVALWEMVGGEGKGFSVQP